MWCDPRNGSEFTFLKALQDLSRMASHPELESVPWCLWGHSGGAFWASLMQTKYPERIVAIWFRSGTAFTAWEKGEIPKPSLPPSMFKIPMVVNPGAKERGDGRFDGAWTGGLAMFLAYRAQDAPIAFAPDPRTAHETGDSRYLAIPFFDACLRMRLPRGADPVQPLRPVVSRENWLAPLLSDEAVPASKYKGSQTNSVWLPNAAIAKAWSEYVRTGATSDTTPPPSPIHVEVRHRIPAEVELTWEAHADFESGLSGFIVQRDGVEIGRVPEKPVGHFGRPLFQSMSYHDTPQAPLPEMQFLDRSFKPGSRPRYEVISINSVGLKSRPSKARWKD